MSNYLAVATVTAAFASLIRDAMHDVPNLSNAPDVRIARPLPDPNFVGAHLFLYRVAPNAFLRNDDLPTRNGDGRLIGRPSFTADLDFVLSFYGNDQTYEPQRLLGRVVTAIHAEPVLSAERVRAAIKNTTVLRGSTLDRELQPVRIVPFAFDLEDLSRMWSVFYQTPYNLSLGYAASVVLLDAEAAPLTTAAPVAQVGRAVAPRMPRIEAIEPARVVTGLDPAVRVRGSGFAGGDTLRFAGVPATTTSTGADTLSAAPPAIVGRVPIDIASSDGAPPASAALIVAPLIGAPSLVARTADGRRTLSVATSFWADPHQRYTFVLYELPAQPNAGALGGNDDAVRGGIELDALVTWVDPDLAGPIAGNVVGNRLAAAIDAAVRPTSGATVQPADSLAQTPAGWRITGASQDVELRVTGGMLAVSWGLAPDTALACDAGDVPAGRYAVALRVDGNAAATSPLFRGSLLFALPSEPAPSDGAPLSAALRAAFQGGPISLGAAALTHVPLPHGAFILPAAGSAPVAWLDVTGAGVTAYALADSGAVIAPVIEVTP